MTVPIGGEPNLGTVSTCTRSISNLCGNNNASANAAMNRAGGMGASSGTPYSSALGQLAMQGASGLQSLFSHGGGGGGSYGGGNYGPPQAAPPTNAPDPSGFAHPMYTGYGSGSAQPWNDQTSSMGREQGWLRRLHEEQPECHDERAESNWHPERAGHSWPCWLWCSPGCSEPVGACSGWPWQQERNGWNE